MNRNKIFILYPCDFFDVRKVDADYEYEYREAVRFPEFEVIFYQYDGFVAGDKLKLYPGVSEEGLCLYRGWMLLPEDYRRLFGELAEVGLTLMNTVEEYVNCHEFPNVYPYIKNYTPGMKAYEGVGPVPWGEVKETFQRFMLKDYVKSVKGSDFPLYFDASYSEESLEEYRVRFIELRGKLFDRGIVIKEYVDLKSRGGITNEYRVFYLKGRVLTVSPNSEQLVVSSAPRELIEGLPALPSNFYTVDFAELEDGSWIVIETGDGQVSGLSPKQFVFQFYEALLNGVSQFGI